MIEAQNACSKAYLVEIINFKLRIAFNCSFSGEKFGTFMETMTALVLTLSMTEASAV